MLVGPDESYRLDKRFSCTVNCETEKDRLWELGGVGDGDVVVVLVGLEVEMAGEGSGGCLFAGTESSSWQRHGSSFVSPSFRNVFCPVSHS